MTTQISELFYWRDEWIPLEQCPALPLDHSGLVSAEAEGIYHSTACYRQYVGSWRLLNNRLHLVDVKGRVRLRDGPIYAVWFDGTLQISLHPARRHHATKPNTDAISLLLRFQDGVLVEKWLENLFTHDQQAMALRTSAERGDVDGMYTLAKLILEGRTRHFALGRMDTARKCLQRAAELGHAPSMLELANLLNRAINGDPVRAQDWLTRAATAGLAQAQYQLACLLDKTNPSDALPWFGLAAVQRHAPAQVRWAKAKLLDPEHRNHAMAMLRDAAGQAHVEACLLLGWCYAYGFGSLRSPLLARDYLALAADKNNTLAQEGLRRLDAGLPMDFEFAIAVYQDEAQQGNAEAQWALALWYLYQTEDTATAVSSRLDEARSLLIRAAAGGVAIAEFYLGWMAERGIGTPPNPAQAYLHYHLAANGSCALACFALARLHHEGIGCAKDQGLTVLYLGEAAKQAEQVCAWHSFMASPALYMCCPSRWANGTPFTAVREGQLGFRDVHGVYVWGWMHELGWLVTEDMPMAIHHYRIAAHHGHGQAAYLLAGMGDAELATMAQTRVSNLPRQPERVPAIPPGDRAVYLLTALRAGNLAALPDCLALGPQRPDLAFGLGEIYGRGEVLPANTEQALYWYQCAAEQGHIKAGVRASRMLLESAMWAKGLSLLRRVVASGHGEACLLLADYLRAHPDFARPHEVEACLKQAADQGHGEAQWQLGQALWTLPGGDREAALHWTAMACKAGHGEAYNWLAQIAHQGDADAQIHLGLIALHADAPAAGHAQGLAWLRAAAKQGVCGAMFHLAQQYAAADKPWHDQERAFAWYRMAAEHGNKEAAYQLALCFEKGLGTPVKHHSALRWCSQAALDGHVDAQRHLGWWYSAGIVVSAHLETATRWYTLAAEQGDAPARAWLKSAARRIRKAAGA